MTTKITWNFIEFEIDENWDCVDGVTKESEVEFHIWNDEEIIFCKSGELSDYNNICVLYQEQKEIFELAKMFIENNKTFFTKINERK